ncbi:hypothetical protein [Arachidicoccus terrestris]|uniref:hypothetical protein n=1 Tax=Arachidicoccus terrestris TaxID=2875539 RepID=UPI001CC7DC15|nr:hypothetical protein [Arachidicoccus terrestris]UAY55922.1 hypothetical protein K9M52_02495 [Arachidicoccus terrestris]
MIHQDKRLENVDPAKLDNISDQKYPAAVQRKTGKINEQTDPVPEQEKPYFTDADDGASSADEEQVLNEDSDNVTGQEASDLDKAATRMPQHDDILDQEFLEENDSDGTPLNESDEALGEDLDLGAEDADANMYDDNE